jgi:hypothetical protein
MDTVHSCNHKLNKFWRKNPEAVYAISLSDAKIIEMEGRYRNMPNPNMKGMSWLPQDGDEGIGFRYTQRKEHA